MANYHKYSIIEVTNKENIGLGFGENENGEKRICISLPGRKINSHLDSKWNEVNWISMSIECIKQLHKNLDDYLK